MSKQEQEQKKSKDYAEFIHRYALEVTKLAMAAIPGMPQVLCALIAHYYTRLTKWSECTPEEQKAKIKEKNLSFLDLSSVYLKEELKKFYPEHDHGYGRSITGLNLEGSNLESASLRHLSLNKAIVIDAYCWGADFCEMRLLNSNLTRSNLSYIGLFNTVLEGTDVTWTNMSGVDFTKLALNRDKWGNPLLRGMEGNAIIDPLFLNRSMVGVNCTGANLTSLCLNYYKLNCADFAEAKLDKANLIGVQMKGTDLRKASLQGAWLADVDMNQVKSFEKADIRGARLIKLKVDIREFLGVNVSPIRWYAGFFCSSFSDEDKQGFFPRILICKKLARLCCSESLLSPHDRAYLLDGIKFIIAEKKLDREEKMFVECLKVMAENFNVTLGSQEFYDRLIASLPALNLTLAGREQEGPFLCSK